MTPRFPDTTIIERAPVTLVGISIRTPMHDAPRACQALWERFLPWVCAVHGTPACTFACPSYGISIDTDMQTGQFTYMAAIDVREERLTTVPRPQGALEFTLAGGTYAATKAPSLEHLSVIYTTLYGPWAREQELYEPDWHGACFEYYDEAYCKDGSFVVYMPVKNK